MKIWFLGYRRLTSNRKTPLPSPQLKVLFQLFLLAVARFHSLNGLPIALDIPLVVFRGSFQSSFFAYLRFESTFLELTFELLLLKLFLLLLPLLVLVSVIKPID